MLINRLTLKDFGVFRGETALDLEPRAGAKRARPVVLFGGLNGSGKTTLLLAIRLAFFGRLATGFSVSAKAYEAFIDGIIHKNSYALVHADSASVSVEFQHSQLGQLSSYRVVRSWTRPGGRIVEALSVHRDGKEIEETDQEQKQALLNQLIPIGIADLFFFDGEKISKLATEDRETTLADSVKRLVGLHVVERLQGDLTTFLRQKRNGQNGSKATEEVKQLETERHCVETDVQRLEQEAAEINAHIVQTRANLEAEEAELARLGGAWAKDRSALQAERNLLAIRRTELQEKLRDELAGVAPLSLLEGRVRPIVASISSGIASARKESIRNDISARAKDLRQRLTRPPLKADPTVVDKIIQESFGDLLDAKKKKGKRDQTKLSEVEAGRLLELFDHRLTDAKASIEALISETNALRRQIEGADLQLARAPAEALVSEPFARVRRYREHLIDLKAQYLQRAREIKTKYWECFDLTRKLRRLEEGIQERTDEEVSSGRAAAVLRLLGKFAHELKAAKLTELSHALRHSFDRLARKSDLIGSVKFDPATFSVSILDKHEVVIPKKKLSAGEQQIFAIAILDALLTCSGRTLPLVIDTPLGRLDSIHRERLVKEYFPNASHQVIVLSTDSEVDERFYEDLAPFISRAYHLRFDDREGCTTVESGYFWRSRQEGLKSAA